MNHIVLISTLAIVCGCTTLVPIESSPDELREQIISGGALEAGDKAEITTTGGEIHKLVVASVTKSHVVGDDVSIRIDDIIFVSTREYSRGKTIGLVATVVGILLTLYSAADAADDLYGGT